LFYNLDKVFNGLSDPPSVDDFLRSIKRLA
jgi:hypothetical protein